MLLRGASGAHSWTLQYRLQPREERIPLQVSWNTLELKQQDQQEVYRSNRCSAPSPSSSSSSADLSQNAALQPSRSSQDQDISSSLETSTQI